MFARLGRMVGRRPGLWAGGWVAAVALLVALAPSAEDIARAEPRALLPEGQPYRVALGFERRAFPDLAARTRTVLVFEASPKLTDAHEAYLRALSERLTSALAPEHGWRVQSPYQQPFLRGRLLAADGAAAMLVVNSDTNYLTLRAIADVNALDELVRASLPAGLRFEITGEGGLGRDLALASREAFDRTTAVTLVALLLILAAIYRAPLAALVPLAAIGLSVVAAIALLHQLTRLGWGLSTFEKTIVVVLLFGSGTDFALFWLASFRERAASAATRQEAAALATARTGSAIWSSAATTICGLLMLMSADLLPSFNAGRALAIALTVSLAAALTLVPALALLLGRALYWPRAAFDVGQARGRGWWGWAAGTVVRRPAAAVAACAVLFVAPAIAGTRVRYTYDAFGVIPPESSSARGRAITAAHFPAEQLFSWTCLIAGPRIGEGLDSAEALAEAAEAACRKTAGVVDVWSLARPLGGKAAAPLALLATTEAARRQAAPYYYSPEEHALRLEIMLASAPLSDEAMRACAATMNDLERWARATLGAGAQVYATGLTPYILNVKAVSDRDHARVVALVIGVIFLIVLWLVRDLALALVMLVGTLGVYLVTLGITEWFFVTFAGAQGIDWKVKLFAFVILVAVGQDYNIFLVTRLLHERRTCDARESARRAIAGTGAVISSCGAIMAATLGSLAATGLPFFQQLGLAFATGVLVDTFVIRPVFVPGLYVLLRGRGARRDGGIANDEGSMLNG